MPIRFTINENLSETLADLRGKLSDLQLVKEAAKGVQNAVVENFRKLEQKPNKQNFPKIHFWSDAARSTAVPSAITPGSPGQAILTISKIGVALQRYGGDVKPVNKKWLTIPATLEAYGKTAPEFQLRFVPVTPTFALLVRRSQQTKKLKGKSSTGLAGEIMFRLVKETHHVPHPEVLPTNSEMASQARLQVKQYIAASFARKTQLALKNK